MPPAEPRTLHDGTPVTVVHVVRHGEVHNPRGVLYGRLPGYHLSERGRAMAAATAGHLADEAVTYVAASPLERAQETAGPIAEAHRLPVVSDERLLESTNHFEGMRLGHDEARLWHPRHWPAYRNPFRPSWGEPYQHVAARMMIALDEAREQAEGYQAVLVSHQLPVWTLRRAVTGRRLWHHPRHRECTLASVTSVLFHGILPVRVGYAEPAAHLLPGAVDVTGTFTEAVRA
jgi:broad specificity phosphatase PhoE